MKDFDQFFGDKLNEEQQFSNRDKNWRAMSRQLDVYSVGKISGSKTPLRIWQAAASIMLLASVLMWRENASLRKDVANLQEQQLEKASAAPAFQQHMDTHAAPQAHNPQKPKARNPWKQWPGAGVSNTYTQQEPINSATPEPAVEAVQAPVAVENKIANCEKLDQVIGAMGIVPGLKADVPTLLNQSLIKPVRKTSRFRFGVNGIYGGFSNATAGVPNLKGVGLEAEWMLGKGISVVASADKLHYQIDAEAIPDYSLLPIEVPKYAKSFSHHNKYYRLKQVEAAQEKQVYTLGIRVRPAPKSWIQPVVGVGYVMIFQPESIAGLEYELTWHSHPNTTTFYDKTYQKTIKTTYLNNIRLEAGLEHRFNRIVAGLFASYDQGITGTDTGNNPIWQVASSVSYQF